MRDQPFKTTGWVMLRRGAVRMLADRIMKAHGVKLDGWDRHILTELTCHVDSRTRMARCTQVEAAELVGLSRQKAKPRFDRLHALGLIEVDFVHGGAGSIKVSCYDDLIEPDRRQRLDGHAQESIGTEGSNHKSPGRLTPQGSNRTPLNSGRDWNRGFQTLEPRVPITQGPLSTLSDPSDSPSDAGAATPRAPAATAAPRGPLRGAARHPGPPGSVADSAPRGDSTPSEQTRAAGAETVVTPDGGRRAG